MAAFSVPMDSPIFDYPFFEYPIFIDSDTTILRETPNCEPVNEDRGALNRALWRARNDELLISRQARALAEAASIIRSLESALGSALNAEIQPLTPTVETTNQNPPSAKVESTSDSVAPERVSPVELTILPTVYTNIGSLLDVFA